MEKINNCLVCGACCAHYRASFYWAEGNDVSEGGVPVHLTEKLNENRRVMIGTNRPAPFCIALQGIIGSEVHCRIYLQRASICRDFNASWINGVHNERCDKARIAWKMLPLTPDSWYPPKDLPAAA